MPTASILPLASQNLSTILAGLSFFRKIATPLACDENELNIQEPPHSSFIVCSIDLQILVSQMKIKSGFFFFI